MIKVQVPIILLILLGACVSRNTQINQEWKVKYPPSTNNLHYHQVKLKKKNSLDHLSSPSEIFWLNGEDTSIVGKKGTTVTINRACLAQKDGTPVEGPIRIELKETFTKSDLLLNNKPTISDGRILVSAGAFYINATAAGQPLEIVCENGAYISLPKQSAYPGMKIFNGLINAEGNINWVLDSIASNVGDSYLNEFSYEEGFNEEGFYNVYNEDSSIYLENDYDFGYDDYFNFSATKFGWINCDAFYEDPRPRQKLIVKISNPLPEDFSSRMYLIFKNNNTILPVYSHSADLFESPLIPEGEEVYLVCIAGSEKALFSEIKELTVSGKKIENITLLSTNEKALKERLNSIN